MTPHVIRNPVPTPEELAELLGLEPERVTAVRKIMETPAPHKKPDSTGTKAPQQARKTSSRSQK